MSDQFTLANLADAHVLCIGDVVLDVSISGTIDRISPEAPVPILQENSKSSSLGGAGLVARNLVGLGVKCSFLTAIGDDDDGDEVKKVTSKIKLLHAQLFASNRITTRKTRLICSGQQLFRTDHETTEDIDDATAEAIKSAARAIIPTCGAVILSDYAKGCLRDDVCAYVIEQANLHNCPVFCDPKGQNYQKYSQASFITPNYRELQNASVPLGQDPDKDLNGCLQHLQKTLRLDGVLATRSSLGCSLWHEETRHDIAANVREVFNVIGAGDALIAVFASCIAAGAAVLQAAQIANLAGGIVVGQQGPVPIQRAQLQNARYHLAQSSTGFAHDQLIHTASQWRIDGLKIGFTNGCFDILHAGHIYLLAQARSQCDRLIVAINSDRTVRKLKGDARPITSQDDRAMILQQLEPVDAVTIFDEDTPIDLITQIAPDVLIKGGDYHFDTIVGARYVHDAGGRVHVVPTMPNKATSAIVAKIQQTSNKDSS